MQQQQDREQRIHANLIQSFRFISYKIATIIGATLQWLAAEEEAEGECWSKKEVVLRDTRQAVRVTDRHTQVLQSPMHCN